ncbi:GlxA family transcriptional regulator [Pelagibaculum spongiae]|uniref:AraC family transcriptional regulator n=1 Tax=Pelagibaculum spongiae TaxID=2080658 RepID=A0A2V1GVI9_9GAMM|nr:helix-turn-helix domain-containing protein [Pelagibaculum spongiae]PVZ64359.1 AraC family transcriptional regulator [Pelagibaculum spongiae]
MTSVKASVIDETTHQVVIQIVNYPQAMQSAVSGLDELFQMANRFSHPVVFSCEFVNSSHIANPFIKANYSRSTPLSALVVPPSIGESYYLQPENNLLDYIRDAHSNGSIICSACAGAFIVAACGLADQRQVTTHWGLADIFRQKFTQCQLDTNQILINDGDLITAGGLMSWLDLGLELVAQFAGSACMRQLGKFMIVDTGARQQRYYQSFTPSFTHGDELVLNAQHHLQKHFNNTILISELASIFHTTERTLLRRFSKATTLTPLAYLQRVRVQKACDLIENSSEAIEQIALQVGYQDSSSFRKIFQKIIGLTPGEFKARFVKS